MRIVKVTHDIDMGSGNRLRIETEIIVGDDDEAADAGREAQSFFARFLAGLEEGAEASQ